MNSFGKFLPIIALLYVAGCVENNERNSESGFCVAPLNEQIRAQGLEGAGKVLFENRGGNGESYALSIGYGPKDLSKLHSVSEAERMRDRLYVRVLDSTVDRKTVVEWPVLCERPLEEEESRKLLEFCSGIGLGLRYHSGHGSGILKPIVRSYWFAYAHEGVGTMVGYFEEGTENHDAGSLRMVRIFSALRDYAASKDDEEAIRCSAVVKSLLGCAGPN